VLVEFQPGPPDVKLAGDTPLVPTADAVPVKFPINVGAVIFPVAVTMPALETVNLSLLVPIARVFDLTAPFVKISPVPPLKVKVPPVIAPEPVFNEVAVIAPPVIAPEPVFNEVAVIELAVINEPEDDTTNLLLAVPIASAFALTVLVVVIVPEPVFNEVAVIAPPVIVPEPVFNEVAVIAPPVIAPEEFQLGPPVLNFAGVILPLGNNVFVLTALIMPLVFLRQALNVSETTTPSVVNVEKSVNSEVSIIDVIYSMLLKLNPAVL
jgi:hypothetical protein